VSLFSTVSGLATRAKLTLLQHESVQIRYSFHAPHSLYFYSWSVIFPLDFTTSSQFKMNHVKSKSLWDLVISYRLSTSIFNSSSLSDSTTRRLPAITNPEPRQERLLPLPAPPDSAVGDLPVLHDLDLGLHWRAAIRGLSEPPRLFPLPDFRTPADDPKRRA
jgi:hypothetical protein